MEWYYTKDQQQTGPISQNDLMQKISVGEISSNDFAWRDGMTDWLPISNIPELQITTGSSSVNPPATPQGATPSTPHAHPAPQMAPSSVAKTSGLAIASLSLSLAAVLLCGSCGIGILLAIPAIICGHLALGEIKRSNQTIEGKPMAIIGLVIGYLIALVTVIAVLFIMFVGTVGEFSSYEDDEWDEVWTHQEDVGSMITSDQLLEESVGEESE